MQENASPQSGSDSAIPSLSSPAASQDARLAATDPASGCLPFRAAVTVAGMDLDGRSFLCKSYTEVVAASGCSLALKQALAVDDELDVRIGGCEVRGRVAGKIKSLKTSHVYAIEFDDGVNLAWGVNFPPNTGHGCTLPLRCGACDLAGDVMVSGIASLVFQMNSGITRTCPRCCERTRWGRERGATRIVPKKGPLPAVRPHAEQTGESVMPLAGSPGRQVPQPQSGDKRKSRRVQLKGAKACIQRNGRSDEVKIVDLSRGGLRFLSCHPYERGDWLRVAAPYVAGGNNIFVGAELVRVHQRAGESSAGEYALVFRSS